MSVVDFIKRKREFLTQHPFELKDWLSPAIYDYWREFQQKAHLHPLLGRVFDLPLESQQQQTESSVVTRRVNESLIEQQGGDTPAVSSETAHCYNQLLTLIGQETHVGEWLHISQALVDEFAAVTGDNQWIHTNPSRAATESPFKATIAHGFLTLALLPQLTGSADEENSEYPTARMVVNFGLEQVRFPYPIKVGSHIRARTKLTRVTLIKGGVELLKEIKVEIEGIRRPGCVVESITRIYF